MLCHYSWHKLLSTYHTCPVEFVVILLEFCYSFFVASEIYAPWSAPPSRFRLKNIAYNLPGKITTGSSHQSLIVQDKQDAHLGNSPPPFPPSSAPSSSSPGPADSPVPSTLRPRRRRHQCLSTSSSFVVHAR